MSFDKTNFSLIATGPGTQIFQYPTDDAGVETTSYFDEAAELCNLKAGDIIFASLDLDGTPALKMYIVSSVSSANVVTLTGLSA